MTATPEDWTALKSILSVFSSEDWERLKYECKIGLRRAQEAEDYAVVECAGCQEMDYKAFIHEVEFNKKTYYLCRDCLKTYSEVRHMALDKKNWSDMK